MMIFPSAYEKRMKEDNIVVGFIWSYAHVYIILSARGN